MVTGHIPEVYMLDLLSVIGWNDRVVTFEASVIYLCIQQQVVSLSL